MSEEGKKEENKKERRFSQEQYEMLKRCSEKKDITEWNEWRVNNPEKDVLLKGARLNEFYLEGALLNKGLVEWDNKTYEFTGEVYLENADLEYAHLENANLGLARLQNARLAGTHLENADLRCAYLENADLGGTHLENAHLFSAHLENAHLSNADLENAYLGDAHLENAHLVDAHLENAILEYAHLENADLVGASLENAKLVSASLENACLRIAHLQGTTLLNANLAGAELTGAELQSADCSGAIVDGKTLIWECKIDRMTNFQGVGLDSVRIDPKTKQLLECNIRRKNWEEWYKEHWFWRWPVQAFWAMSDYGMSTLRVVGVFLILALLFAAVYMNCAYWSPPGVVYDLLVQPEVGETVQHYFWRFLIRPIYFSVVTMTTLGFGDMYANKGSIAGHVLLILQVILGYVLLGALVTRFAVLFTAGGPAGKFAEGKKKQHSRKHP